MYNNFILLPPARTPTYVSEHWILVCGSRASPAVLLLLLLSYLYLLSQTLRHTPKRRDRNPISFGSGVFFCPQCEAGPLLRVLFIMKKATNFSSKLLKPFSRFFCPKYTIIVYAEVLGYGSALRAIKSHIRWLYSSFSKDMRHNRRES